MDEQQIPNGWTPEMYQSSLDHEAQCKRDDRNALILGAVLFVIFFVMHLASAFTIGSESSNPEETCYIEQGGSQVC